MNNINDKITEQKGLNDQENNLAPGFATESALSYYSSKSLEKILKLGNRKLADVKAVVADNGCDKST